MLVGAGIGLTPCSSILSALTKYRWKKNFNPEIVHLYWVVRQAEVDSFQWLVHLLTELSFELKKAKEMHQIEKKYYCEINIYLTQADKNPKTPNPLHRASRCLGQEEALLGLKVAPSFTADQLYAHMMNPTVDSKGQVQKMKSGNSANRFQDIWVWNGRPNWDEIFREVKDQRQHTGRIVDKLYRFARFYSFIIYLFMLLQEIYFICFNFCFGLIRYRCVLLWSSCDWRRPHHNV